MTSQSPFRSFGHVLNELLSSMKIDSDITSSNVLAVLRKYVCSFDDRWPYETQQRHFELCICHIKDVLEKDASATDTNTFSILNKMLDDVDSTIAAAVEEKHVAAEGYQTISSALSQLRQTLLEMFTRLNTANKKLATDLSQMKERFTTMEARLTVVEADSLAMKKANFIADLMAPIVSKIFAQMETNKIDFYWYSPRDLDGLRNMIECNPNWSGSHPIGEVIKKISTEYQIPPTILVEHLRKKQERTNTIHYTWKMRVFAGKSAQCQLNDFITENDELQSLNEFERVILQPVFSKVCHELLRGDSS